MAKYSRMEKFEQYRKDILLDNDDQSLVSEDLQDFSNRLNAIDTSIASDIKNTSTTNSGASHYRTYNNVNVIKPEPRNVAKPIIKKEDNFKNEYLDEFIDEVKKYNVAQGYSSSEDTSVNIINGLKQPQTTDLSNVDILDINNDEETIEQQEKVLDEQTLSDVQAQVIDKRNSITQELQTLLDDDNDDTLDILTQSEPAQTVETVVKPEKKDNVNNKLLEQTAQQTVKLSEKYDDLDDDMDEMEDRIGSNTRLVNFLLIIFIMALIVIFGFILYAILMMKGII